MKTILALIVGTFASEDLTCIAAGHLVRMDQLEPLVAIMGCFLGIYLGDLGLWLLGRTLGRRALSSPVAARFVHAQDIERFARWFDRNSAAAVLCSRFIPGARLPMYLGAGAAACKPLAFAGWSFLAALLWTPLVVLLVASLGHAFARPFEKIFGAGWVITVAGLAAAFIVLRLPRIVFRDHARERFIASISKIWRWEFWPMAVFYLPAVPWIAALALRHRSLTVITAANPGIPHGGIVGESKREILDRIAGPHVIPGRLIHSVDDLKREEFPVVLKPDAGQRGAGVRFCEDAGAAAEYLRTHRKPALAQPAHPGPYEAGIFYIRMPGELRGRIFSITDKRFPLIVGDGVHTIRQLIYRHPRFRMQAATFLARHHAVADRVLPAGGTFQLARAGNHCQGTMFCDGSDLLTPQLERAIDEIARRFPEFHFGRFDLRYGDVESFKRGQDFEILELNGITSESSNLYDPSFSLFRAYAVLFRQWQILFRISAANRAKGIRPSRARDILRDIMSYYCAVRPEALSD